MSALGAAFITFVRVRDQHRQQREPCVPWQKSLKVLDAGCMRELRERQRQIRPRGHFPLSEKDC